MELVRATTKDTQILLEIEKTTIGLKVYSRWKNEEEMRKRFDEEVIYLINDGKNVVGSISYEIKTKDHADISAIVIKPEFQRQGFAKQAMRLILEELKGYKKLSIEAHPDNHSVKLYEAFGFVVETRKENYYDGEPRIIMVKTYE